MSGVASGVKFTYNYFGRCFDRGAFSFARVERLSRSAAPCRRSSSKVESGEDLIAKHPIVSAKLVARQNVIFIKVTIARCYPVET